MDAIVNNNNKNPGMQRFSQKQGKALLPCSLQTAEGQPSATNGQYAPKGKVTQAKNTSSVPFIKSGQT